MQFPHVRHAPLRGAVSVRAVRCFDAGGERGACGAVFCDTPDDIDSLKCLLCLQYFDTVGWVSGKASSQ